MTINMARGDIHSVIFTLYEGDTQFLDSVDDIFFTVKKKYNERNYKFQKRLSMEEIQYIGEGQYEFTIQPEDTDKLDFGDYDFDIEVVKMPSLKQTFNGVLHLEKEVTHSINEV